MAVVERRVAGATFLFFGVLAMGWWMVTRAGGDVSPRASVTRGDLVFTVEVEGTLAAVHSHLVTPPAVANRWEFKISRMAADGAEVKEGEAALSFDTSELERSLLGMTAALDSAEKEIEKKQTSIAIRQRDDALRLAEVRATLRKAELKLERPQEFVAKKEIQVLELDRDIALKEVAYLEDRQRLVDEADAIELSILREQRDQAALSVRELRDGIERMTIRAPRDGTIIHVTDRRGEKKRVGDAVWRRDKILEIPDLTWMMARGLVDEADAGRIEAGQRVELRLDAYPDVTYTATIGKIGKTIQPKTRNSPLRVVRVDIALDETDETRMRPEMRFRGSIEVGRHRDVLLAPLSAVRYTAEGAIAYRRTLTGSRALSVKLGARNAESVEIVDGLSEGDQISVRP